MIWPIFTLIFGAGATAVLIRGIGQFRHERAVRGRYVTWPVAFTAGVWLTLATALLIVGCVGGTASLVTWDLEARKMALMLPAKEAQREALIVTVRTELSNDQYAQLVGITDPNAFVVFAQGTAVSDYLIARGGQIVALNAEIYALHNELTEQRIDVCNALDNPFYPRLPFVGPNCEIDTEVTS